MSSNQNNTGPQENNSKTSFSAKKISNDKPVVAYAHADAVNHEMERPLRINAKKRKFNE
jgi:hypothetical protein